MAFSAIFHVVLSSVFQGSLFYLNNFLKKYIPMYYCHKDNVLKIGQLIKLKKLSIYDSLIESRFEPWLNILFKF